MTKQELYEMEFETACEYLKYTLLISEIKTYEQLKDIAIEEIENNNLTFARAILEDISNQSTDYFYYREFYGTIEPLNNLEDLEQFCEN